MSSSARKKEIEFLSPKQNGSAVEDQPSKENKATIKGMWKKAFKSLKVKDKDKEKDERSSEKGETSDKKYSRSSSRQTSLKKMLRRKDSEERDQRNPRDPRDQRDPRGDPRDPRDPRDLTEDEYEEPRDLDPVFATLMNARRLHSRTHSESTSREYEPNPVESQGAMADPYYVGAMSKPSLGSPRSGRYDYY